MQGENEPSEIHEVDVDIEQTDGSGRPKWLLGLLGVVAAGALIAGVAVVSSGDDSEVDVAAVDDDAAVEEDDEATEPPVTTTEAPAEDTVVATTIGPADFATEAMATDFGFGGGPGGVVFDGDQFVAFGCSETGPTVRTSTDGIDWDERSIAGFDTGYASMLVEHDGTYVTVIEQWDEESYDEAMPFGPSNGPTYALAVSTDLDTWTFSDLPLSSESGYHTAVTGLALADTGLVILAQSYPEGPDEMRILFEAGILTETDFEWYCGLEFTDDAVIVNSCDYNDFEEPADIDFEDFDRRYAEAETDEERQALEEEFEELMGPDQVPIATITEDDPLFAELQNIYDYDYEESPSTTVLAGPVDGQLALATLPAVGHTQSIVAVDDTFVVVVSDYTEAGPQGTVLTSTNGLVWADAGEIPDSVSGDLHALNDDVLLLVGIDDQTGAPALRRSSDLGATWTAVEMPVDLYGAYPMVVTGPAGVVAFITGSSEPMPNYGPEGPIVLEKDGYTLTIDIMEDGGLTLTGPEGEIIHSLTGEELEASGNDSIPNVVRTSPVSGTPTFLDPDTGEDLVSFTDRDFEEAYGVFDEVYEEPDMTTVVLFSADGLSWSPIEDDRLMVDNRSGGINPLAVGDDEVIVASYTWNEPPEELFAFEQEGRDPTEEEIAALDAWEMSNNGGDSTEFFRIELS